MCHELAYLGKLVARVGTFLCSCWLPRYFGDEQEGSQQMSQRMGKLGKIRQMVAEMLEYKFDDML